MFLKRNVCLVFLTVLFVVTPFLNLSGFGVIKAEAKNTAPDAPTGLLTELMPAPMAIEDLEEPEFNWEVNDSNQGEKQTAYQIRVHTSPAGLANGDSLVWDSGKVDSDKSSSVSYRGPVLDPATRYYWTVKTWDKDGQASEFSKPATFGTAMKNEWTGASIWQSPNEYSSWKDYTVEADVTIENSAAGIEFRAEDSDNLYMWQFSVSKGGLAPHVKISGGWKQIDVVEYPFETGKEYHIKIEANGQEITTFVDGEEIDTRTLSDHMGGAIGVRHGSRESSYYDNVTVTSSNGNVLYDENFTKDNGGFTCGSIEAGKLYVGNGAECLNGGSDDMAFFRKEFELEEKEIKDATVYVTGLSPAPARQYVYKLSLNGEYVGVGPIQGYSGQTFYNAYDVTEMIKQGEANAIGAIAYTQQDKRFLAELHVTFADGSKQVIKTDDTWQALNANKAIPDGGNIGTGYYYAPAEDINAKEYPFGYSTAEFDSNSWADVIVKEDIDEEQLTGQPSRNLKEVVVSPEKVVDKGDGTYFIDFGHAVTGGFRLQMDSSTDREVEIRLGEELKAPQTVRYDMRTGNTYRETWQLKEGEQTLKHWGYRVFRYAEVHGLPEGMKNVDEIVSAVALRYPFNDDAAEFTSSNETLNTVWEFSKNSIRNLNHDLYYDSTTRERRPYEADAYIQQLAHYAVDKEYSLARVSHEFLYDHETWPTEWKQISILGAWQDYLFTGDKESLAEYYDVLKDKALNGKMTDNGLVKESEAIVDWPAGMRDGYQFAAYNTVVNAYDYRDMVDLAKIAEVLNKPEDVEKYKKLAAIQKEAINTKLFDSEAHRFRDGLYEDGSAVDHYAAHANFFPVALGAATEENAELASEYIAERGMVSSVYGAPFTLEALFRNSQDQKAIDLLTSHETNSWMNMIEIGAGATMEAWDPSQKGNLTYSHPWAASPAYIVPREMFGIKPLSPAFKKFKVTPRPGQIKSGEIKVPTIKGAIEAEFNQEEDRFELKVNIPANTKAVVSVPASSKSEVTLGGQAAEDALEVEFIEETDGFAVYEVGSGAYTFVTQKENVVPFAPDQLTVTVGTEETENTLNWEDQSNYEEGFLIERKTENAAAWEKIGSVSKNETTFTDSEVEPEQRYAYRVTAFNEHGSSSGSIVSIFTIDANNIAYQKPVTATAEQNGNEAPRIVDGDPTTRWSAEGHPQSVMIDLEGLYSINNVGLTPYQDRAYQYKVEASANGEDYTVVVDRTSNTEGGSLLTDEFKQVNARFVKVTVTGAAEYSGGWSSIEEFRVYGTKAPELKTVSLQADHQTVLPSEQVDLEVTGTITDNRAADLSHADIQFETNQPGVVSVNEDGTMIIADYVKNIRTFDVWATLVLDGKKVKSAPLTFTLQPTIAHTQQSIEDYESSDKIREPLLTQLSNSLKQASHHKEKGHIKQVSHFLDKFLKHINNQPIQKHIDPEVKEILIQDVETLIEVTKNH